MQFKHPELLYALFALLIPILIHLFQLRKFKKQPFTNVAFLKKVTSQTRKSSQLKKWLILLTRMLLLAALIIAFAQPFTSKTNSFNTTKETVIYLDNSFSMQAKGEEGELFKRAIQNIINHVDHTENLSLFTNNSTFKNTNIEAIKNELLQLDYTSNQLNYEAVLLKGKQLFNPKSETIKEFVCISDFQIKESVFQPTQDSLISINAIQLKPVNTNNLSIDSLYVSNRTPSNIELTAMISNSGSPLKNVPVSLFGNGSLIAKSAIDITDTSSAIFTINNEKELIGSIQIDDASLVFDNSLYFNINKPNKTKVLAISNTDHSFLKRIYTKKEFLFSSKTLENLNYSTIEKQNLIILNELEQIPIALSKTLKAFTENGGFVIVIPSIKADLQTYNSFFLPYKLQFNKLNTTEKQVTSITYGHPLFKDVFNKQVSNFQYPKVESFYPIISSFNSVPLKYEDQKAFLSQNGSLFVFSAPLESKNSNFKNSPLIVPTFYNIGKQSLQNSQLYQIIGEENQFDISITLQQDDIITLSLDNKNLIPQQQYFNNKVRVTTSETPNIAGTYQINNNETFIEHVSYNYKRDESVLQYQDLSTIKNVQVSHSIPELLNTLKSNTKINELWKWFVIFALGFLAIELLILKYFK